MADPLLAAIGTSASGLDAQALRLRIISENLANAQSTGNTPGADPYRRKTVSFGEVLDRLTGAKRVEVKRVQVDPTPFRLEFDPGNPAANASGYVKTPNVNMIIEMADMREANRSYEANLEAVKQSREMLTMTVDLLRSNS
jgi:flagellar basal-body rod protein FlgC